jgi:hypothetical protein
MTASQKITPFLWFDSQAKEAIMNPSELIDNYIADKADWRGDMVARLRQLILEAAPGITEAWKWNSPVWSHGKPVCSARAFKQHGDSYVPKYPNPV